MIRLATFVMALCLCSCGPVSLHQAEAQCFVRANQARSPLSGSTLGMGSAGLNNDMRVTITSDFIQGRDPSEVYNSCVFQKSGQPPSRPLYDRPDWRG
jgi:hypothetical protein